MLRSRAINTLMEPNQKLGHKEDVISIYKEWYQCLEGKLIYLSHTKPDIAFAINIVS